MSDDKLWIVLVTYAPNIQSLQKIIDLFRDHHLIIVDNTGGEPFLGLRKPKQCVILPSEVNIGYGGGANRGLQYAFEHGAVNTVVINQDTSFSVRSVQVLHTVCRNQKSSISGPVLGWIDPIHFSTDLTHRSERFYVSGSCMVISKDVFESTNGFNETYFMYYEDADLCMRVKLSGYTIEKLFMPGFRHDDKAGIMESEKEYYLSRNHLGFVMKFAPFDVKMREFFRIPLRMFRYTQDKNIYALRGIADFLLGVNGKRRE